MKKTILILITVSLSFATLGHAQPSATFPENALLNKPIPEFTGTTLAGKKIDKAYFKRKVTLVNFMYIGCFACMKEINVLNQLHTDYKGKPGFEILGISGNTADQLL